jgi:hypothetical protein
VPCKINQFKSIAYRKWLIFEMSFMAHGVAIWRQLFLLLSSIRDVAAPALSVFGDRFLNILIILEILFKHFGFSGILETCSLRRMKGYGLHFNFHKERADDSSFLSPGHALRLCADRAAPGWCGAEELARGRASG